MAVSGKQASSGPTTGSIVAWKPDARRAGRATALILSPHLVLGTWLLVVPDHRAFLSSQVVTLLHTALAIITLPIVIFWIFWHARRMAGPRTRNTAFAFVVRWSLVASVIIAVVTGFYVIWGGDITPTGKIHALCAVIVGVPLACHLWLASHRHWAIGVMLLLAAGSGGSVLARKFLPPEPLDARVPNFEFKTRSSDLYEPAAWCGECHEQDYSEWKRSTHARTLLLPGVKFGMNRFEKSLGFDLTSVGQIVKGARPPDADQAIFSCESCHAPAGFYGDDKQDLRKATGILSEAVTCSFCHTLRDVKTEEVASATAEIRLQGTADYLKFLPKVPQFVSAPETVRRYIGQGSKSEFMRTIANYLIRWRPSVHSHDYHSPLLDTSASCLACHGMGGLDEGPDVPHKTYISWKQSPYNTGDPKTTVTCQDCHMTRKMTGKPVVEEKPMVSWGPPRKPGRSHLILGGNAQAAEGLEDHEYAELEHEFNTQAARVTISSMKTEPDYLAVAVAVESLLIGHYLPSMETHNRWAYVQVRALDAQGKVIAETSKPKGEEDFESPSPLLFRCTQEPKPECDTLLRPKTTRIYTAHLELPKDAKVAKLEADLWESVDPKPMATTSRAFAEIPPTPAPSKP